MAILASLPRSNGDFGFRSRCFALLAFLAPLIVFGQEQVEVRKAVPVKATTTIAPPAVPFSPGAATTYTNVFVKGPYIAMTFDDGPSAEYTPGLLDELKKRNIKATFFLIGQNAQEFPQIVSRIVGEGHEVANHSWSHPAFAKMSDTAVASQIQRTQDAIYAACGVRPTLLRPPYGSITKRQKPWIHEQFGLQIILWSVDPYDWKKPGEAVVRSRIVNGAHSGAIILAHDIHGSTVRAMPETFDQLLAKGYKFVTVSELLAMEQPKTPTQRPAAGEVPQLQPAANAGTTDPKALPTPIPLSSAADQLETQPGTTPVGDSTPSIQTSSAPQSLPRP